MLVDESYVLVTKHTRMEHEKFIFCLEGVLDIDAEIETQVVRNLEEIAIDYGIASIYKNCDTIEGLEESLSTLLHDDHNFKDYEIIYLVLPGNSNTICLNNYFYSLEEIAELFEGKMKGKIIHFANKKILDISPEEAQYFLDITGARAISGYGSAYNKIASSSTIDKVFFRLYQDNDDLTEVVEELFVKHYDLCKLLDFKLYY